MVVRTQDCDEVKRLHLAITHPAANRSRWLESRELIVPPLPTDGDFEHTKNGVQFDLLTWSGTSKLPFKFKADAWGTAEGAEYNVIG